MVDESIGRAIMEKDKRIERLERQIDALTTALLTAQEELDALRVRYRFAMEKIYAPVSGVRSDG